MYDNPVAIMQGDDEGIFSWFTLNFLSGEFVQTVFNACMNDVIYAFDLKMLKSVTVFCWLWLVGGLSDKSKLIGILDLGGGSTQITFVPVTQVYTYTYVVDVLFYAVLIVLSLFA